MKLRKLSEIVASTLAVTCFALAASAAEMDPAAKTHPAAPQSSVDRATVDKLVASYPPRPQLAAQEMMAKYGPPQEASSETLVWHSAGPFKRIMITRVELHHDFPKPHMDFLEHTVDYRVPAEKASALLAYDGSATINRTAGEISARCDLEGHNILTLNLAHDIIAGKKDVKQARMAFGQNVVDDTMGKHPSYVEKLQFNPAKTAGMFPDTPVIPGSPKRVAMSDSGKAGGDGEILGFVGAVDENEVLAAAEAQKKKISGPVLDYAKMLHKEHGRNVADTLKLGQKIGVTPLETPAVDKLRVKGASELAALIPLDGDQFASAYIAAMVKGHAEALDMIDNQLLKNARNDAVKKHLTETRRHVDRHLQEAKKIQSAMKR